MLDQLMYALMIAARPEIRARKIESVTQFVKNQYFCELVHNIDVYTPKRFNYGLFATFDGIEELRTEVNAWITYG